MLDLAPEVITSLPIDRLAVEVLRDLQRTNEWNERNYTQNMAGGKRPEIRAVAEATGWLRAHNLIARDPSQSSDAAIFITRAGHEVLREGLGPLQVRESLAVVGHPLIGNAARSQFLLGEWELGVFAAMKAVEVRVRKLAGLGDEMAGVDLMNQSFGPSGALTDPEVQRGEQEGTRALFAGAYAVLRNPAGHRQVDYDDIAEAAEAVHTASMLMRILDRVERRLSV